MPHIAPRIAAVLGLLAVLALSPAAAQADWFTDEAPPANAKPLSEIIKALEDQGYKQITEIAFDDGVWEIEVRQADGTEVELKADPVSGDITTH